MSDGSTKIKNGLNLQPVSADPSNPAEGDLQFSDGTARAKGLWQYSNGNWAEIGGGGQGGINYLAGDNSDAENGIGDWVTYADAAGENAVDGTGGTALGVTLTQNATDPLREAADFKFSKDAADRQGEGASVDFTIDNADKAQKLTISFDYDASNANYADDDIRIAIYDVTNAKLIRVNGEDLKGGKGTHLAQFQTAADSTSYRLIIHQSSTNATAYDVYLDNISVGPREVAFGAIVTDAVDYTPGLNSTTNVSLNEANYSRVGDSVNIQGRLSYSGVGNASQLYIDLPSGLVVDTNKLKFNSGGISTSVGYGSWLDVGARWNVLTALINQTADKVYFSEENGANLLLSSLFASGDEVTYNVTLPIQGWSSNAVTSEDLGGREVVVAGRGNGGGSITINVTPIDFTETIDTTGSWDGSSFTCPETGYYLITGSVYMTTSNNPSIRSYVDGSFSKTLGFDATSTTHQNFNGTEYLEKGQVLTMRSGAAITLSNDTGNHHIHIQKLASPQTILETETVAARYRTNAGTSITTSGTTVPYEDLDYDTHNAYNTSTGVYTIPVTGKYHISGSIRGVASTNYQIWVDVNGTAQNYEFTTTSSTSAISIQDKLNLSKGDLVKIVIAPGTNTSLNTDEKFNVFSISRIK